MHWDEKSIVREKMKRLLIWNVNKKIFFNFSIFSNVDEKKNENEIFYWKIKRFLYRWFFIHCHFFISIRDIILICWLLIEFNFGCPVCLSNYKWVNGMNSNDIHEQKKKLFAYLMKIRAEKLKCVLVNISNCWKPKMKSIITLTN